MVIDNALLIKIYKALIESKDIAQSEGYYNDVLIFSEIIRTLKEEMSRELGIIINEKIGG